MAKQEEMKKSPVPSNVYPSGACSIASLHPDFLKAVPSNKNNICFHKVTASNGIHIWLMMNKVLTAFTSPLQTLAAPLILTPGLSLGGI